MRESFRQKQEVTESLKCQEELRERLHEESRAREQLAVELSKAEGKQLAIGNRGRKTFKFKKEFFDAKQIWTLPVYSNLRVTTEM